LLLPRMTELAAARTRLTGEGLLAVGMACRREAIGMIINHQSSTRSIAGRGAAGGVPVATERLQ
jgi:hypothetical protein